MHKRHTRIATGKQFRNAFISEKLQICPPSLLGEKQMSAPGGTGSTDCIGVIGSEEMLTQVFFLSTKSGALFRAPLTDPKEYFVSLI